MKKLLLIPLLLLLTGCSEKPIEFTEEELANVVVGTLTVRDEEIQEEALEGNVRGNVGVAETTLCYCNNSDCRNCKTNHELPPSFLVNADCEELSQSYEICYENRLEIDCDNKYIPLISIRCN